MRVDPERTLLVAVAGLTSGIGAASVNIAARFTSDPGDVLGLAGGALGAGLAVLGAVWLERFKDAQQILRNRIFLIDGLLQLGVSLILSVVAEDKHQLNALLAVRQNFDSLSAIRKDMSTFDSSLRARLATFDYWAIRSSSQIDSFLNGGSLKAFEVRDFVDDIARRTSRHIIFVIGNKADWPSERWEMIDQYLKDVRSCKLLDGVDQQAGVTQAAPHS